MYPEQSFYADIADFHEKFGLEYEGNPRMLETDMALFRIGFMIEELAEYAKSSGFLRINQALEELHETIKEKYRWVVRREEPEHPSHDLETQFDSLIDLVYVALGTSYLHGVNFDEGWRRVHEANMAKVRVENEEGSKRKSKFDVVKPKGWKPASLKDLVGLE